MIQDEMILALEARLLLDANAKYWARALLADELWAQDIDILRQRLFAVLDTNDPSLARVLLVYHRALALCGLRIIKSLPGSIWCTDEFAAANPGIVCFTPVPVQYTRILASLPQAHPLYIHLHELLKPMAPSWLNDYYTLDLPGPDSLM
jgi:hypothetical protein